MALRNRQTRSNPLTVLVLGVGGNVSQGILKALAMSNLSCRVIGACISPLALGLYTVDRAYISPRADAANFYDWLVSVCKQEGVQAVLSGVEPVLDVLSRRAVEIHKETGALCIVSDPTRLAIGDDKLTTCQWLEAHGINFPRYAASENRRKLEDLASTCGYPLMAKPRKGKGGHGLIRVRNPSDLDYVSTIPGYLVQEYLDSADSEYTIGCFSDQHGQMRGAIVMRRELLEGTTYRAEVGAFPTVRAEAIRIAAALQPMGPCNIQLRLSSGQPVCFEINVRFSGTTPLRARFGFNEVEASLRHYVLGEPAVNLPYITRGIALRYWNEMYVDARAHKQLESGCLMRPTDYPLLVEDYAMKS